MRTRLFQWILAAILICGASVFTSCTKQDNPVNPADNLAEKIIGKWITADMNGQPAPTNEKKVITFVSATKCYMSASLSSRPVAGTQWLEQLETDVSIDGNKMTLTGHPKENTTTVDEYTITHINDNEFTANRKLTIKIDGNVVVYSEDSFRYVKVARDHSEAVLGLWECKGLSGGETYNDGNDRLEFLADGTYRYYRMDDNNDWQTVTNREFQDYFVDGTLLATRWKNQGEDELREWWEIESLNGNEMVWTALRQNAGGSTFQQKMTWKKIDLKVAEKILGKWILAGIDGQASPTNMKSVFTFVSTTKAYVSASLNNRPDVGTPWDEETEADVVIDGNKINLTLHNNVHTTTLEELIVTDINDSEFSTNFKVNKYVDGNLVHSDEHVFHYVKAPTDYRTDIIGTWEGQVTSSQDTYGDGQEHRWQYNADGTYVYYVKDDDNWVPSENTLNEYFVDGTLLCTRWVDNEQENREWWEITIADGKMNWTALRQNEDGTTFTATFEMKKVE